jgi:hypothetical protein
MSQSEPREPSRQYIRDLLQTDVNDTADPLPKSVNDLLTQDYPLANLTSADRKFFRLMADNIKIFAREQYPAQDSFQQGALGATLMDDPTMEIEPLSDISRTKIESALLDHFARTSRGVGGWQQDKFSESIQTNRVEDNRGEADSNSGSLLDKL